MKDAAKRIVQCAGSDCADRDDCRRYDERVSALSARWASYDVERQHFGGDCPQLMPTGGKGRQP